MTRRQVLDVGDVVLSLHAPNARWKRHEAIILGLAGGRYRIAPKSGGLVVDVDMGWDRHELERVGGDLQLGDWARVEGECRSAQTGNTSVDLDGDVVLLVDTCTDEFGDEIFLVFRREMPSINAIAVPAQLTRITRAEALA